jgi:hypothetical protein
MLNWSAIEATRMKAVKLKPLSDLKESEEAKAK